MPSPIDELIDEVRLLYQSLVQIGEHLHADTHLSLGMRGVLEYLQRNGAATVPNIARARRVSRQRIQTLVNPLLDRDLARVKINPESKRSPLIALTAAGARTIRGMRRREAKALPVGLSGKELTRAARTLAAVRRALEAAPPS